MSVGYLDLVRGERPGVGPPAVDVKVLLEVGVEELEDEVEDGLAVLGGLLDGEEADDVDGVGEEVEEGDLAERGGRDALLVHLERRVFLSATSWPVALSSSLYTLP